MSSKIIGKNFQKVGVTPSIILCNPKYAHNVGMVLRLCSCFDVHQLWYTGERVRTELEQKKRLPREERMKGYEDVELINYDYPFDQFKSAVPVAVEVRENSENLFHFEHPENAVYVFGPEDGSISSTMLRHCHRFLVIPTRHCLNLSTAVSVVLYDRNMKLGVEFENVENRGFVENIHDLYDGKGALAQR